GWRARAGRARRAAYQGPAVTGEDVGAGPGAPAHEGFAFRFRDVLEKDQEGLHPGCAEPRVLALPPAGDERRAHRLRGVAVERVKLHAATGSDGRPPSNGPGA